MGGDKDVRLVLRFLGTTPSSSDFETLLRHLCAQIYSYEVESSANSPADFEDYEALVQDADTDTPGADKARVTRNCES